MFKDYDQKEKEAILFRIRTDLMIDLIPISLDDLIDSLDGKLTAKELFERILFIDKTNTWENFFKEAISDREDLEKLAKEFDLKSIMNTKTYYCKDCTYEGNEDQFLHIVKEGTEEFTLQCPDCEGIRIKRNS